MIPVFNGANYMREAIDSALAQTWANTEVIVVNDGSTDGGETDRIASSYGDKIRYISKPNGGVASALNSGIEAMTGEIFCWLSHDDLHLPEKTEKQVSFWTGLGRPSDVVLYSDYTLIDASGARIKDVLLKHEMLEEKPLYGILRGSIHGCSVFVPRDLFGKAGLFDAGLPTTQDYDLWFRMTKYARFVHMKDVLIKSRWHDEQGSKKIDHVVEANTLWSGFLEKVSTEDQVAHEGSAYRFQKEMEAFLRRRGLSKAADDAAARAEAAIDRTLVSVVIPVHNRPEQATSAVNSALAQTHPEIEVVVVDDGSTCDMGLFERAVAGHPRVRVFRQESKGAAAARTLGWSQARGEFVAFLDSGDLLLPEKIAAQIRVLVPTGGRFCHTSHWLHRPGSARLEARRTGRVGGPGVVAEISDYCEISASTVMVRRDLLDEGFGFPDDVRHGEDALLWIRMAARHGVQGLDRLLTIARAGASRAGGSPTNRHTGLENILAAIANDPALSSFVEESSRLRQQARLPSEAEASLVPAA